MATAEAWAREAVLEGHPFECDCNAPAFLYLREARVVWQWCCCMGVPLAQASNSQDCSCQATIP
eukprot:15465210-Alexandrium_andersonii.AAC.1